jgi:hypothetical protein
MALNGALAQIKSWLPVILAVAAIAAAWATLKVDAATLRGDTNANCLQTADHETRLRVVEEKITRIDERTAGMADDLKEIKEAVK